MKVAAKCPRCPSALHQSSVMASTGTCTVGNCSQDLKEIQNRESTIRVAGCKLCFCSTCAWGQTHGSASHDCCSPPKWHAGTRTSSNLLSFELCYNSRNIALQGIAMSQLSFLHISKPLSVSPARCSYVRSIAVPRHNTATRRPLPHFGPR